MGGHFDLVGVPPAPRGRPQIEVSFDIDANGILNVSAKDKGTGKDQSMQIQTSGGLTKEEIENMKKNAESMAAKDKIDDELREEINTQVAKVRELRGDDNANQATLKEEIEKLNKCMSKIGEKIYQNNPQSSDSSSSESSENTESNENASESTDNAEYEEKKEQ